MNESINYNSEILNSKIKSNDNYQYQYQFYYYQIILIKFFIL